MPGELATVVIVVGNHESAEVNYTIEVWLSTLARVFNNTTQTNETVEVATSMIGNFTPVLADGVTWRSPFPFHIDQSGAYALKFLLYKGAPAPVAYRTVRLPVTVT